MHIPTMNQTTDAAALPERAVDKRTGQQVLTAHQAALLVGIPVSTFNYHLRRGRIEHIETKSGISYITEDEAWRFARRLRALRTARQSAAWDTIASREEITNDESVESIESDESLAASA